VNIEKNCVVSIHFTLSNGADDELDTSKGNEPSNYMHGTGSLLPVVENALEGKMVGDKVQITVEPKDGFGETKPELTRMVPASSFEGVKNLQEGMRLDAKDPSGHVQPIIIEAITKDGIIINGNHPLAGQVLKFDISVESIREATEEEIEHGHIH
jgi:FKBP-type peptidyl-prolyl cis-trans isomerase SlyD